MRRGCEVDSEASKAERKFGEAEWQIFGKITFCCMSQNFLDHVFQMPLTIEKSRRLLLSPAPIFSRQNVTDMFYAAL